MKYKTTILILSIGAIFLSSSAFASLSYDRQPSGQTPSSPLTITISADDFTDLGLATSNFWDITAWNSNVNDGWFIAECYASTSLSVVATLPISPVGQEINEILIMGYISESDCLAKQTDGVLIFEQGAQPEGYASPLFTISQGNSFATMPATMFSGITGALATNIPIALGIIGALLAIKFIVIYVRRQIYGKK
jgi:hypothetical protein